MTILSFNESESSKICETLHLYLFVKELLIYNEIIDPQSNTFPQILNELRNAYDHLNRVLCAKFEVAGKTDEGEYIVHNLDKVLGHVYRACYDCLDWLTINVREDVLKELEPFSHEAINNVLPDYYTKIRPSLAEYDRKIAEFRNEKDIAHMNAADLDEYAQILKELTETRHKIIESVGSLIDYDKRRTRDKIIWIVIPGVIGVVIGYLVKLILG